MRDTRTGAARKGTPKGAAVDRTGKGGMPTPKGGSSSEPKPAPKGQPIAPRGTSTKTPAVKAKVERAKAELREKEKRQKEAEARRAKNKSEAPKLAGRYRNLAGG